ncbi:hypothetical protein PPL_03201 [Heterostelium album PN500]|uniref:Uncharacterized protein n=1 Tax=Heterostelium pallidum (strain ATCC 26659 / Pp 5 / PN500) TaxID=670386 RepID=D3B480_HETP5|nr:hypothetical protein PPL_03201 [Heterostelium album PN500]EFA84128.1 hypothetical protein PPL_03201 [Heterostelium album PN500]|eukprot:XP_020436245.1 hypothetical protein PPL_03201 [Heterostelium album PN500]
MKRILVILFLVLMFIGVALSSPCAAVCSKEYEKCLTIGADQQDCITNEIDCHEKCPTAYHSRRPL